MSRIVATAHLQLRTMLASPLLWALLGLLALTSLSLNVTTFTGGGAGIDERPFVNSPHAMAWLFGMSGFLLYSFYFSIQAGMAPIRDDEVRISELLHSTPLTPAEQAWGKLLGLAAGFAVVVSLHVLSAIAIFQLAPLDAELGRGPFRWSHFVLPAVLFAGPLSLYFAGLAFAVGRWSRRMIAVVALPIGSLFVISSLFSYNPAGLDPSLDRLLIVLDPTGLRWLLRGPFALDRGIDFYNHTGLQLDGVFWLNRLLTLAVPLVAVALSVRRFDVAGRRRPAALRSAWRRWLRPRSASRPAAEAGGLRLTFRGMRELGMTSSPPGLWTSLWSLGRAELRELLASPGLYIFTALILGLVTEIASSASGLFGAPEIATAGGVAADAFGTITFLICLVLLFFAVESLHRERATRFEPMLFSTPARTGIVLAAKALAQAALVAILLAACSAVTLALLALQPEGRIEVLPLALVWGLLLPPTFFLWSAFVTATFALLRDRYLTYAVGLGALLLTFQQLRSDALSWASHWTLVGAFRWSDLAVFELDRLPLLINRLAAVGLGVALFVLAVRLFARGERDATATLLRLRPARLALPALRLAPWVVPVLIAALWLAVAARTGFQGDPARQRAKAYWRDNVATWGDFEPPAIRHADLDIELDPARRTVEVQGRYTLANLASRGIDRLPFTARPSFEDLVWQLDGRPVTAAAVSDLYTLELAAPLPPGGEVDVAFRYRMRSPRGSTRRGGGVEQFVLPSGTALHTLRDSFLPLPGFVDGIGIDDGNRPAPARIRSRREELPVVVGNPPFTARIQVTAPAGYTVNSVGRKTAEHTRGGLTTVVWESDHPVTAINLVAGRWDVRRQGDTAVYFHPGHPYNVDEILGALVAARHHYSAWFHPYPWKELKLSEFPDLVTNAQGFPTNIPFSEGVGFLTRDEDGSHPAFLVTAHEAAHQWWGNLVGAGELPGTAHLIEGMAHYSALLLHEAELGPAARRELTRRMETSYLRLRRSASERPLLEIVADRTPAEWTVVYEKGAWVMWMLQQQLGREAMLAGLRDFVGRYAGRRELPATQDLLAVLRGYAGDAAAYDAFVEQWFYDVVLPDLRLSEVDAAAHGERWRVSASVHNRGSGTVDVEIAAFGDQAAGGGAPAEPSRHTLARLGPGERRRVSWRVDFEPRRVVIDPDVRLLQASRALAEAKL